MNVTMVSDLLFTHLLKLFARISRTLVKYDSVISVYSLPFTISFYRFQIGLPLYSFKSLIAILYFNVPCNVVHCHNVALAISVTAALLLIFDAPFYVFS